MRGTTRYWTGLTARARRASICSVTFIVPISAAICDPARAATTTPVSTGVNSRETASAMTPPTNDPAPYCSRNGVKYSAMTAPDAREVSRAMGTELTPMAAIWSSRSRTSTPCRPSARPA